MELCKRGHPMTDENRAPNGAAGFTCRICRNASRKRNYDENLEASRASGRERSRKYRGGIKGNANLRKETCPQGHPYDEANTYFAPGGARQCRACRKVRVTESYYRNHEKRLAEKTAWREANAELHRQRASAWIRNNRDRANLTSRLKKQRRRAAGVLTPDDWNLVLEIYGAACLKCGKDEVTIDHIIPVIDGGANLIGNVQPLCGKCNSSKGPTFADYRPFPIEHVIGGAIPDPRQAPEAALTLF